MVEAAADGVRRRPLGRRRGTASAGEACRRRRRAVVTRRVGASADGRGGDVVLSVCDSLSLRFCVASRRRFALRRCWTGSTAAAPAATTAVHWRILYQLPEPGALCVEVVPDGAAPSVFPAVELPQLASLASDLWGCSARLRCADLASCSHILIFVISLFG